MSAKTALLALRPGSAPEPQPTAPAIEQTEAQTETEPPTEATLPPTQPPQYSLSFSADGAVLTQWLDTAAEEIQVPGEVDGSPVTAVGAEAFSGCAAVKHVSLPGGITAIEDGAFAGCGSLTGVDLPETLERIGARAFQNCGRKNSATC